MAAVSWLREMFHDHGVSYVESQHPNSPTAQDVAHHEHTSGHRVAKVVVVMADDKPIELVLPASRQVNLDAVRRFLGARSIRLANEAEMERHFPDCEVGAIPPVRHWEGIDVIMDSSLDADGDILFQAGTHTDAFRMNFADWFKAVRPRVFSFTATAPTNEH